MGNGSDNIEGRLDIHIRLVDGAITDVAIQSSRPLLTPRIFTGKSVEHLLTTLPLLYSICGTAQANAAVTACEQALGIAQEPICTKARSHLVSLETAKEHLWRVLLDWPDLLGLSPEATGVGETMQLIKRYRLACYPNERPFFPGVHPAAGFDGSAAGLIVELETLLEQRFFGMPAAEWLALGSYDALLQWADQVDTPAAAMLQFVQTKEWNSLGAASIASLPNQSHGFYDQQLDDVEADQFIAAPQIDGCCFETSPFTRVQDHPLVAAVCAIDGAGLFTRQLARLVELAGIPSYLRNTEEPVQTDDPNKQLSEGVGIAQIEAARGRLIHRVVMDNELITRYQILAPTEWNFHPSGVVVESLKVLNADSIDQLKQQAAFLINAIDPCVGYELHIEPR
ncbi:nickel-dependent hydrogenase large subunit [Sedimenticola selenatireducens]|uniref:Ni,Fe-hydrogenase I large subunit n=1 Tax=Sedimenticola selenatireducens TaxID=191960 RepID=A0A558DNF1_9GAMM|nr:nickel-dependent hydrogenase large subunit [Sedimenticola selenatireducens]TVO74225.1 hypothetical protein FHP88_10670 [Sedimenticola selenatireducens]TVT62554.1 MAG: hypothetical protein FHK78_14330 [Sedimenticola selenatireducens]